MDKKLPLEILVSNDDGIHAQGMRELAQALSKIGHVTVVAPDVARSGASAAITSANPLRLKQHHSEGNISYYSCTGTPTDCVKLALNALFNERKPDILLAGINHGANEGISVIYSGTLGAAMEGAVADIPSIAVSLSDHNELCDFSYAIEYALRATDYVLKNRLPYNTLLSINVPKGKPLGMKICPVGNGKYTDEYMQSVDSRGNTVYWMGGSQINKDAHPEVTSDIEYLRQGYATLSPVHLNMTDREFLPQLESDMDGIC